MGPPCPNCSSWPTPTAPCSNSPVNASCAGRRTLRSAGERSSCAPKRSVDADEAAHRCTTRRTSGTVTRELGPAASRRPAAAVERSPARDRGRTVSAQAVGTETGQQAVTTTACHSAPVVVRRRRVARGHQGWSRASPAISPRRPRVSSSSTMRPCSAAPRAPRGSWPVHPLHIDASLGSAAIPRGGERHAKAHIDRHPCPRHRPRAVVRGGGPAHPTPGARPPGRPRPRSSWRRPTRSRRRRAPSRRPRAPASPRALRRASPRTARPRRVTRTRTRRGRTCSTSARRTATPQTGRSPSRTLRVLRLCRAVRPRSCSSAGRPRAFPRRRCRSGDGQTASWTASCETGHGTGRSRDPGQRVRRAGWHATTDQGPHLTRSSTACAPAQGPLGANGSGPCPWLPSQAVSRWRPRG